MKKTLRDDMNKALKTISELKADVNDRQDLLTKAIRLIEGVYQRLKIKDAQIEQLESEMSDLSRVNTSMLNIYNETKAREQQLVEALEWVNKKANNGWYGCTSTRSKMIDITDKALYTVPDIEVYRLEREIVKWSVKEFNTGLPYDGLQDALQRYCQYIEAHREKGEE